MNTKQLTWAVAGMVLGGVSVTSAAVLDFTDNFDDHPFKVGSGTGVNYNANDATWGGEYTVRSGYVGWNNTQSDPNGYIRLNYQSGANGVGPGTNLLPSTAKFGSLDMVNLLTRNGVRADGDYEVRGLTYRDTMVVAYQDVNNFLAYVGGINTNVNAVAGGNGGYSFTSGTYNSALYAFVGGVAYPILGLVNTGSAVASADDVTLQMHYDTSKSLVSVTETIIKNGTNTVYSVTGTLSAANFNNLPAALKSGGLFGVMNHASSSAGSSISYMSFTAIPEPTAVTMLSLSSLTLLLRRRRA